MSEGLSFSGAELERLAGEILEKLKGAPGDGAREYGEENRRECAAGEKAREAESARLLSALGGEDAYGGGRGQGHTAGMAAENGILPEEAQWTPLKSRRELSRLEAVSGGRAPRRAGAPFAAAGRNEGFAAAGADVGGLLPMGGGVAAAGQVRLTAESLSEAFCRDARRYDGGFEKY